MSNLQKAIRKLQLNNKLVILCSCGGSGQEELLAALTQNYTFVDLSLPNLRLQAQQNPQLFLRSLHLPAHLANLQCAPFLLTHILAGDWPLGQLIGSCTQNYYLAEAAQERVAFLELPLVSNAVDAKPFVPSEERLQKMRLIAQKAEIPTAILRSGAADDMAAYVRGVLQRNIMERTTVSDEVKFYRFLCVAASTCGSVVNYAALAGNVGVTAPTIKQWLQFLVGAGIVYLLPPVADIAGKRLVKAPKLYFKDTGIAAYLLQLYDLTALVQSVYFKNLLENYAVNIIRESFLEQGLLPDMRFYKDSNNKEINLLLVWQDKLYPIYIALDKFYGRKLVKSSEIIRTYADREGLALQKSCAFTLGGGCAPVNESLWQVGMELLPALAGSNFKR